MAFVVLLRGVNVGGHRIFQPAALARELKHLDAVNIGAAGTFVIRRSMTKARLRAELTRRIPFDGEIMICDAREIVRLMSRKYFGSLTRGSDVVRFVSILSRRPRLRPTIPITLPADGPWLMKIVASDHRFVVGAYRRHMKAIGYLGRIDRLFGVPATTRNWNTMTRIVTVLGEAQHDPQTG